MKLKVLLNEAKKFDNSEIANMLNNEGEFYAVKHMVGPDNIIDKRVSKLWAELQQIVNEFDRKMKKVRDIVGSTEN